MECLIPHTYVNWVISISHKDYNMGSNNNTAIFTNNIFHTNQVISHTMHLIPITGIDDCRNRRCQNGGTCIDSSSGMSCRCRSGTYGANCENFAQECPESTQCHNGGSCTGSGSSTRCVCSPGFSGRIIDFSLVKMGLLNHSNNKNLKMCITLVSIM